MSKPRGLYTPVYASLPDHPKTVAAAEALRCDEVKFIGHMVCLWTWCLTAGSTEGFTAAMLARGARWPKGRAQQFADALTEAGFLEAVEGGYAVHEWSEYGGKVAGIQQADRDRHAQRTPRVPRRTSAEIPQSLPGHSSLDETRREEIDEEPPKPPEPERRRDLVLTARPGTPEALLLAVHQRLLPMGAPTVATQMQIEGWATAPCARNGCLPKHVEEAELAVRAYSQPPRFPWKAFHDRLANLSGSCTMREGGRGGGIPIGMPNNREFDLPELEAS